MNIQNNVIYICNIYVEYDKKYRTDVPMLFQMGIIMVGEKCS